MRGPALLRQAVDRPITGLESSPKTGADRFETGRYTAPVSEGGTSTTRSGFIWVVLGAVAVSAALGSVLTAWILRAPEPNPVATSATWIPLAELRPAWDRRAEVGSPVSILQEDSLDAEGALRLGENRLGDVERGYPPKVDTCTVAIERPLNHRVHLSLHWRAGSSTQRCLLDLDAENQTAILLYDGHELDRDWVLVDVRALVEVSTWKYDEPFLLDVSVSGYARFDTRRDPRLSWRRFKIVVDG